MSNIWACLLYWRSPPGEEMRDADQPAPVPAPVAKAEAKPAEPTAKERAAAAIAAVVLVAAPLTAGFEGLRLKPYKDPVGIPTVCYGETELEMRVYSKDECGTMLRKALGERYAPHLLKCVPALVNSVNKNRFAALLDASYNAGWGAACKSRMARAFNAGQWTQGCNGFVGWYETAKGKKLPGLVRRRAAEKALCLKGV